MRVDVHKALLLVAQEFAQFKTPKKRTAGFQEQQGQKRGEGDILDTVGTFLLTHYLGAHDVPTKLQLALRQGDEYDVETNLSRKLTINLKTSAWQPKVDDFGKTKYHMAIKESEFEKMTDIFLQAMVHLNPPNDVPHIHLCGFIETVKFSVPLTENPYYGIIPHTGESKGLWRLKAI